MYVHAWLIRWTLLCSRGDYYDQVAATGSISFLLILDWFASTYTHAGAFF